MEILYQRLPKDLVNIIEEYAKDRTNYNKVVKQFQYHIEVSLGSLSTSNNYTYKLKHRMSCPEHYENFLWHIFCASKARPKEI